MLLQGKKGVVMGVAGHRSIATSIVAEALKQGAEVIVSYLEDERGKNRSRVEKSLECHDVTALLPCDVRSDQSIQSFFTQVQEKFGSIDFIVHSIAWAPQEDLKKNVVDCSRGGFAAALDASVYSFISVSKSASSLMQSSGHILTLSYYGAEKVIPGYNLMGIAKAALEAAVRYLSCDLGSKNISVNALSAGPLKTLASAGIPGFSEMQASVYKAAPLQQPLQHSDVGQTACFLLSDFSRAITGEVLHVDCGYHTLGGWPQ
ncbi:MAG: enoyl-ACP reductase [Oligoflexales bacterium]